MDTNEKMERCASALRVLAEDKSTPEYIRDFIIVVLSEVGENRVDLASEEG